MKRVSKAKLKVLGIIILGLTIINISVYASGHTWGDIFDRIFTIVSGDDWDNLIKETNNKNPDLVYPGVDNFITERNASNLLKTKWYELYEEAYTFVHTDTNFVNLKTREEQLLESGKGYLKHVDGGYDEIYERPYIIVYYLTDIIEAKAYYQGENANIGQSNKATLIAFSQVYYYKIYKDIEIFNIEQGDFIERHPAISAKSVYIRGELHTELVPSVVNFFRFRGSGQSTNTYTTATIHIRDYGLSFFRDENYNDSRILAWYIKIEKITP